MKAAGMHYFPFLAVFLAALPIHESAGNIIEQGNRQNPVFSIHRASGARVITGVDRTEDIQLSSVQHHGKPENILYLTFDAEKPRTMLEDTGRYRIMNSSYIRSSDSIAGLSAHFSRLENKIQIHSPPGAWPLENATKDFTIEMWVKPYYYYRKNEIFRKTGIMDGRKTGISINIEDQRLICRMENLFQNQKKQRKSIVLISRKKIPVNQWSYISVSYQASTGKTILLVDNTENDIAYARENADIFHLKFHELDHSPLTVGETYSGLIDELRISSSFQEETFNKNASKYPSLRIDHSNFLGKQATGIVYSKVLTVPHAKTGKIKYISEEPEGSILAFYVRASMQRFSPDEKEDRLPWQRIEKSTDRLNDFKYLQWKAEIKSDPEGRVTPLLKSVSLQYDRVLPPSRPSGLRVIPELLADGKICLEWIQSPEVFFNSDAGYIIHYGMKKGKYTGRIQFLIGKDGVRPLRGEKENIPITPSEAHQQKFKPHILRENLKGKVRHCLDNRMVSDSIHLSKRKTPMPFFKPMHTYYFTVSAWSKAEGESELSNEITVVCKGKTDL